MTRRDFLWLFAVVLLAVALCVCIVLGMTGFFSSLTYLKSQTDLVVGDSVTVEVEPNAATTVSLTLDGAYFPGEQIPQIVQISALNCNSDLKLRVKSKLTGSDENFSFITSDHFIFDGEYFLYDDLLEHGTKVTFCIAAVVSENSTIVSGERYILTIVVEAFEEAYANQIWGI